MNLKPIHAWTDYPFAELGDVAGQEAPVRRVELVGYDHDKYVDVIVMGVKTSIKSGYVYKTPHAYRARNDYYTFWELEEIFSKPSDDSSLWIRDTESENDYGDHAGFVV
jgi:hypothetical protein